MLELPWDQLKTGRWPDPDLVKEQADKYKRWGAFMPPLSDWYAKEVGCLPLQVAHLACQRSNCWWDAKQLAARTFWTKIGRSIDRALLFEKQGRYGDSLSVWRNEVLGPTFPLTSSFPWQISHTILNS